jgi:molybdate transport repressor ModE-like protein
MNLSQLELIRAIHEKGSISSAAETVGFTQSAASRALAALEAELGVTLVKRTRSGGVLTEVGVHLLPHIYEILANAEYIRQDTAARRGLALGKLRVGSIPSMSARLLSQLIGTFRHRYPGIETIVFEGIEPEIVAWLQQGIIDVALVAHHSCQPEDSAVFPITQDELQIIVSKNHRLASRAAVQINDLENESFIMPRSGCTNLIRHVFQEAGEPLKLQLELSDVNTVLAMVKEGLGVTLIPAMSLPDDLPDLHILHMDPPVYRQLSAIVGSIQSASPAARAFIDLAQGLPGYMENAAAEAVEYKQG